MSLFSELKRRNVFRVAAAYGVSCWLLIEIASLLFEAFDFPVWGLQMLITLLALGLIPMLLFSWAYEITPEGLKRDAEVDHSSFVSRQTGRRLDQVTIVMILMALAVIAGQRFIDIKVLDPDQQIAETATEAAPPAVVAEPVLPPEPVRTAPPPERESVAVLPFVNMSADTDNEYFADGISEEILNVLARVEGLKVASRTSSFSFKGQEVGIGEIAGQLGVAHVLEGSVRKQGEKVRITAQLIQASDGFHLWSDTFDRELTDIFAVQEEIAQHIVDALSAALGSHTVSVNVPTQNLEAYQLFLRGRQLWLERFDSMPPAIDALEQAVALDPRFARAWSTLAGAYAVAADYGDWWPKADVMEKAERAARRAIELDPSLAEPYAVLGLIASEADHFLDAADLYAEALARDPRDTTAQLWLGILQLRLGHSRAAVQTLESAFRLDPMVGIVNGYLGRAYEATGQPDLALARHERAAELGWRASHLFRLGPALEAGDTEKAAEHWIQAAGPLDAESREFFLAALSDPDKAADFVELARTAPIDSTFFTRASGLLEIGDPHDYLDIWERTIGTGYVGSISLGLWRSGHRELIELPRFLEVARRSGLTAYWNHHGYPDGCQLAGDHLDCSELTP